MAQAGPAAKAGPGRTSVEIDDAAAGSDTGWVIETVVSPFHCLYQDALHFHTQSRLAQSEGDAARLRPCGALALHLQRRGPGASGRRRAGPSRAPRLARRPQPAAAFGRGLAALAGGGCRARRAHAIVQSRVAPLAAIRRAAHARDLVGLPWTLLQPPRVLPIIAPRHRLRAPRTAPHSPRLETRLSAPRPSPTRAPACRATPTPFALAISIPPAASLTPPSKPLTAAWAAPFATPSATAWSRCAWFIQPRTARTVDRHSRFRPRLPLPILLYNGSPWNIEGGFRPRAAELRNRRLGTRNYNHVRTEAAGLQRR